MKLRLTMIVRLLIIMKCELVVYDLYVSNYESFSVGRCKRQSKGKVAPVL
jgi:hypothetical protein